MLVRSNRAVSITTFLFVVLSNLSGSSQLLVDGHDGIADAASAVLPLGMNVLVSGEHGAVFALCASMEGVSAPTPVGEKDPARTNHPPAERHFPSPLSFRVTATTLTINSTEPPARIDTGLEIDELIKSLQFRLRVNNGGLQSERIQPVEIRMIGVPADVPYGERIYRVIFQVPLSPNARLVLEVVAPDGELLSKFPVVLN